MARSKNIENMTSAELAAMQARIERAKIEKQGTERAAVMQRPKRSSLSLELAAD